VNYVVTTKQKVNQLRAKVKCRLRKKARKYTTMAVGTKKENNREGTKKKTSAGRKSEVDLT